MKIFEKMSKQKWINYKPFLISTIILFFMLFIQFTSQDSNIFVLIAINICAAFSVNYAWTAYNGVKIIEAIQHAHNLKDGLEKAGIVEFWGNFESVDWSKELNNATTFFFFVLYAYSWRNTNKAKLKKLSEDGCKIEIVLPDYRNETLLQELSSTINVKPDVLKGRILEAIDNMKLYNTSIYLYPKRYAYTFYKIDDNFIFVPFKHNSAKEVELPTFKASSNDEIKSDFYSFLEMEKTEIISKSEKLEY